MKLRHGMTFPCLSLDMSSSSSTRFEFLRGPSWLHGMLLMLAKDFLLFFLLPHQQHFEIYPAVQLLFHALIEAINEQPLSALVSPDIRTYKYTSFLLPFQKHQTSSPFYINYQASKPASQWHGALMGGWLTLEKQGTCKILFGSQMPMNCSLHVLPSSNMGFSPLSLFNPLCWMRFFAGKNHHPNF